MNLLFQVMCGSNGTCVFEELSTITDLITNGN